MAALISGGIEQRRAVAENALTRDLNITLSQR